MVDWVVDVLLVCVVVLVWLEVGSGFLLVLWVYIVCDGMFLLLYVSVLLLILVVILWMVLLFVYGWLI